MLSKLEWYDSSILVVAFEHSRVLAIFCSKVFTSDHPLYNVHIVYSQYNGWSKVKTMLQIIASTRECSTAPLINTLHFLKLWSILRRFRAWTYNNTAKYAWGEDCLLSKKTRIIRLKRCLQQITGSSELSCAKEEETHIRRIKLQCLGDVQAESEKA